MMLNIKVQRLKCYRNKKITTEKLRNTNMLDKCCNITLYHEAKVFGMPLCRPDAATGILHYYLDTAAVSHARSRGCCRMPWP